MKRIVRHASPDLQPSRRQATVALVCTLAVAASIALYLHLARSSPDRIRDNALEAIRRGDARALARLANPAEMTAANLTNAKVAGLLAETFRAHDAPDLTKIRIEKEAGQPLDRVVYSVYPARASTSVRNRPIVILAVTDSLDVGWRLDLTWLFYSYCKSRKDEPEGRLDYLALCRKYGLAGFQDYTPAFHDVVEIERKVREIAASLR